jgi:hypothetical protein
MISMIGWRVQLKMIELTYIVIANHIINFIANYELHAK